jgi:hypothetical protein
VTVFGSRRGAAVPDMAMRLSGFASGLSGASFVF